LVFEGLFARARNGDRAAEATTQPQPTVTRPTIGLALGGGAARGFAHIGVMRKLLEYGIVPDVIVGTSIGAVVGGCYAAKEMDNLETWARTLTVRGILSYLDLSLSGSGLISLTNSKPDSKTHALTTCQFGLQRSLLNSIPVTKYGLRADVSATHCVHPTRCQEFFRRC